MAAKTLSPVQARQQRIKIKLGMPFGTAFARLRKAIMFMLVSELKRNVCFRCNCKIEKIDEFSIEHKDAWEFAADPAKAFFDLENISFSHYSCNVQRSKKSNRKYSTKQEYYSANFAKYYAKNGQQWNERRNIRRRAKTATRETS